MRGHARLETIERHECPTCGEEPDAHGLDHLFGCPDKLIVAYRKGTVARRYSPTLWTRFKDFWWRIGGWNLWGGEQ